MCCLGFNPLTSLCVENGPSASPFKCWTNGHYLLNNGNRNGVRTGPPCLPKYRNARLPADTTPMRHRTHRSAAPMHPSWPPQPRGGAESTRVELNVNRRGPAQWPKSVENHYRRDTVCTGPGGCSMPPSRLFPLKSHPWGGGLCMPNARVRARFSPQRPLCAAWAPNPHKQPYRDLGLQVRDKHPEDHLARRPPQHQHGPRRCRGRVRSRSRGRVAFVGAQAPARGAKTVRK
jgi:hypothetical protein